MAIWLRQFSLLQFVVNHFMLSVLRYVSMLLISELSRGEPYSQSLSGLNGQCRIILLAFLEFSYLMSTNIDWSVQQSSRVRAGLQIRSLLSGQS